jgi:hypothetical protein
VKNGDEQNIDCGGSNCPACATCSDGIQNWHWVGNPGTSKIWEQGIDCGGPCPVCWLGVDEVDPDILFLGRSIPNPATSQTIIQYQLPQDGIVRFTIRNVLGREMYATQADNSRGIHQVEVDVSSWSDGMYYITLDYQGEQLIEKMVVKK